MIAYIFRKLCGNCRNIVVKKKDHDFHKIIRFYWNLTKINVTYGMLLLVQVDVTFWFVEVFHFKYYHINCYICWKKTLYLSIPIFLFQVIVFDFSLNMLLNNAYWA